MEAKTLTGSYLLNTDSFYLSFEYVIGMNNTITGMYFISRLDHKKLPKKRFKVVRIFMNSSVYTERQKFCKSSLYSNYLHVNCEVFQVKIRRLIIIQLSWNLGGILIYRFSRALWNFSSLKFLLTEFWPFSRGGSNLIDKAS